MIELLIKSLYEKITGTPWTTVRSCTQEFGPPPGARYADVFAGMSDDELYSIPAAGRPYVDAAIDYAEAVRAVLDAVPRVAEEPARVA